MLKQAIQTYLNTTEREIITLNFGIGSDELSLTAIALKLNLSKERVRQIKKQALKRMAKTLGNELKAYL